MSKSVNLFTKLLKGNF